MIYKQTKKGSTPYESPDVSQVLTCLSSDCLSTSEIIIEDIIEEEEIDW